MEGGLMKFIQIATGSWSNREGMNHTLYGLTADGEVRRWYAERGWVRMDVGKSAKPASVRRDKGDSTDDEVPW